MRRRPRQHRSAGKPPVSADGASSSNDDGFGAGLFDEPARPEPQPEPVLEQEPDSPEPAPEPQQEPALEPEPDSPGPAPQPEPVLEQEPDSPEPAPAPKVTPIPAEIEAWAKRTYGPAVERHPERKAGFRTSSDIEVAPLYAPGTPEFEAKVGWPGEHPYTRGVQPTMYRGRLWTMRQYAGFTSARATNERFRYLLDQGQTGLSVAFDLPTQIGYDSDDPMSEGEVGKVGVPIDSLRDMEILLDGIPLGEVSTSMTINATAPILLAMYLTVAKKQGVPASAVRGTIQNDILKEFAARGTYRFPIDASIHLVTEVIRYCATNVPQWNPISISGYHMREAGCTAAQEIAFTLADGIAYAEAARKAGLDVDQFAGRLSFFFAAHNNLFEEVAKFRAARRLWASIMTERFEAKDPRSAKLRFHTQTAGSTLTSQQPDNNVVRVTLQALSAVLGGTQSLHTNSRDEALGLPTVDSARTALRTQQILAHESGVADVVDPLGGAPYVEALTDEVEKKAKPILAEIDAMGGAVEAVRTGWIQRQIHQAAYAQQRATETGDEVVVGVNRYEVEEEAPAVFRSDPAEMESHLEGLREFRGSRNESAAEAALAELEIGAAWGDEEILPHVFRCVEAYCTIGEICRSLETVYGKFEGGPEGSAS